jgi:hypothetical protein
VVVQRIAVEGLPPELRDAEFIVRRGGEVFVVSTVDTTPPLSFSPETSSPKEPPHVAAPPRLFAPPRESTSLIDDIMASRALQPSVNSTGLIDRIRGFIMPRKKVVGVGLVLCVVLFIALIVLLQRPQSAHEQRVASPVTNTASASPSASPGPGAQPDAGESLHEDLAAAMSEQSGSAAGRVLARAIGLSPGESFLERPIQANGDVSLVVVCSIAATGNPMCTRVSVEKVGDDYEVREIVQPAT